MKKFKIMKTWQEKMKEAEESEKSYTEFEKREIEIKLQMDIKKYNLTPTEEYLKATENFEKADKNFDLKPNKQTAKELADARAKLQNTSKYPTNYKTKKDIFDDGYPFRNPPEWESEVVCGHCGNTFKVKEYTPIDELIFCAFHPECNGDVLDWWQVPNDEELALIEEKKNKSKNKTKKI
jgi:uncharacterized CHY-type Zn-finger protein